MKQCPRCASEIGVNDKVCPRCKLPVDKMGEAEDALAEDLIKQAESKKLNKAQKKEKKRLAKLAKKEAKRKRKEAEKVSNTDFSKYASNVSSDESQSPRLRRKNKNDRFQFEIDENGEFNIDTKDVEIIGEEVSKAYEEKRKQQEYSIKKARGDYRPPRIKWWEIYKLADRSFARRKIKKDVKKASKIKPDFVSKAKLLILAILFGWCGAHNFYAKNKKKGFTSLTFFLISIFSLMMQEIKFFKVLELWLVGFTGFVVISIWVVDIVNIVFNKFEYRIQKEKFIFSMNIETRAKLGEKYIDQELYQKPWWVRFKVWLDKKKRNYHEWQQERRQRLIEKEKAKIEAQEESDSIEKEIAEAEKKELEKIKAEKKQEKLDKKENKKEKTEDTEEKSEPKKLSNNRKAKVSVKTNKYKKK